MLIFYYDFIQIYSLIKTHLFNSKKETNIKYFMLMFKSILNKTQILTNNRVRKFYFFNNYSIIAIIISHYFIHLEINRKRSQE